jgi:S-adenosylmethionine-diacylglycerol 3-amino-3-carboxypropyl transferase
VPSLKFAIMREDPEVEAALVRRGAIRSALLVASGGCTALTLKHQFPDLSVTAFDFNPAQLVQVQDKISAVQRGDLAALNVETASATGLNQRGQFEGLFRVLRQALLEFVLTAPELDDFFAERGPAPLERWFASPFWPVAFQLAFADSLLHALFGPAATQHAEPGSYPAYFQRVFEDGLRRPGARHNPFLQHVLLGAYRREDAPPYVAAGRRLELTLQLGSLPDVVDLSRFQLFSLSNVFDWSDDVLIRRWCDRLQAEAPQGAAVVIRQLNNRKDLRPFLSPRFALDERTAAELHAADRSLFYERLLVAVAA